MSEVDFAIDAMTKGDGYTFLSGLISSETAGGVRKYVFDHLGEGAENSPGDINLTDLIAGDKQFTELATHPRLLAAAQALLGDDCKLAAMGTKILMPGCSAGGFYVDYPYRAMDPGMPGSQRYQTHIDKSRFAEEAIQLQDNAGDAVIRDELLY